MEKMALVLLLLLFFVSIDAGIENWDRVVGLDELSAPELAEFLSPIIQATANAYRYPKLKPIPGWIPAPGIHPLAPTDGAHALVYREDSNNSRNPALILAFRGTDLTSQADLCADAVLFNNSLLDADCSGFSNKTLDYYSQAVKYTIRILDAYPGSNLLVTGHSLGAALAALVSAHFSGVGAGGRIFPVVSFSSPAMADALQKRSLKLAAAEKRKVYVFGDEWDFIMDPIGKQVGVLCLYQTVKPDECQSCDSIRTKGCFSCFLKTHILKHVIDLVEKSGKKPVCNESLIGKS